MRPLRTGLGLAFLLALVSASCIPPARPNVLLLVMDTTRGDRCSFAGYGRPTTPRLEEFAKDAVVFRDAWTPGGWTGPAHATLFTSLRPEHHGFSSGERSYLDLGPATLAEQLTGGGWDTACFTNNNIVAPSYGLTRGFAKCEPLFTNDARPRPWAKATHELAASWAEAVHRDGRPFFLFVNDMEPHWPYAPPREDWLRFCRGDASAIDIDRVNADASKLCFPYTLGVKEFPESDLVAISDLYDAEIAVLDREVDALLARLRSDGLLDDTIVVIVGDHGESLGEHHLVSHGYDLHRTIRHVPLLVRYPGAFDGGRIVRSVVRLEDVAPTILELCGLPVPAGIDGAALTRDLDGRVALTRQAPNPGVQTFLEKSVPGADASRFAAGVECVYDGSHHYIGYTDGRAELYDVRDDPAEATNLAAREPAVLERMRASFAR